jgi:hypothetical protein
MNQPKHTQREVEALQAKAAETQAALKRLSEVRGGKDKRGRMGAVKIRTVPRVVLTR